MYRTNSNLFTSVIVLVAGVIMIALHNRIDLLSWMAVIIGLMFIIPSVYILCTSLSDKTKAKPGTLIVSIGALLIGLMMCIFPTAFAGIFVYVFAATLIAVGVYQIVSLAWLSKPLLLPVFLYIVPALMIVAGVVILCTDLRKINTVVVLITGIALICSAVNSLIGYSVSRGQSVAKID